MVRLETRRNFPFINDSVKLNLHAESNFDLAIRPLRRRRLHGIRKFGTNLSHLLVKNVGKR